MRSRTRVMALVLLTAIVSSGTAAADPGDGWTPLDPRIRPPGTSAASLAYDEARHELVLFGGNAMTADPVGTWIRAGDQWRRALTPVEPTTRYGASMVYDAARGDVVLFGGYGPNPGGGPSIPRNDTWIWDGATWHEATQPAGPSPRAFAAMAYDAVRQQVVLFGGIGIDDNGQAFTPLGDTWLWDGTTWTRAHPATSPPARHSAGMTFDSARGETVLFGGNGLGTPNQCTVNPGGICIDLDGQGGGSGELNDTWTWNGSTWTQRTPAHAPAVRGGMVMAEDPIRERVVLFSGVNSHQLFQDTWAWDGSDWTNVTPDEQPEGRFSASMTFDASLGELVLFGGHRGTYMAADTWGWDGERWASLEIPTPMPRMAAAMSYDPVNDGALLFGGDADWVFGDTWLWNGAWQRLSPALSPPARAYAAMTTDTSAGDVVLFGGSDSQTDDLGDTWLWDGSAWHERTPASPSLQPLARRSAAMAYDGARHEVVMFGGWNKQLGLTLSDTWTWDGSTWHLELPLTSPPALRDHRMAYDPVHQKVVLFGGEDSNLELSAATWTWDGTTWHQEQPATSPPALTGSAMTWDPSIGRVVLFSGVGSQAPELWAWDGTNWQRLDVPGGPSRRSYSAATYLPGQRGTLLFGGQSQGYRDDTWRLRIPAGTT